MQLTTIDDVIAALDTIIDDCRAARSRLGYFPALYRKTTLRVRDGIRAGRFEDPIRMEHLDVLFARRYLDAYHAYRRGRTPSHAWLYTFQMAGRPHPLILHHLLLGMNAHINLDLGIAAAEAAPGDGLPGLRRDFDEINTILGEMIEGVQEELAMVSPLLGTLDTLGGRLDERFSRRLIRRARDHAWRKAEALACQPAPAHPGAIMRYDHQVWRLARIICPPDDHANPLLRQVRQAESDDVPRVIDVLI